MGTPRDEAPGRETVSTVRELQRVWRSVVGLVRRDLGAASRLAADPIATLRSLGYDLDGDAERALLAALPG